MRVAVEVIGELSGTPGICTLKEAEPLAFVFTEIWVKNNLPSGSPTLFEKNWSVKLLLGTLFKVPESNKPEEFGFAEVITG